MTWQTPPTTSAATAIAVTQSPPAALSRRQWLASAGATTLAAAALTSAPPAQARTVKTQARIVILGSGLGGIGVANRLSKQLAGATITVVDKKEEHNYQPGYTLVATGVWPVSKVRNRNADYLPHGCTWVREAAASIDPVAQTITTDAGTRIAYDFLVVATGLQMDWEQIEGMDVAAIGSNGLASVYPSPLAAEATWKAMSAFAASGGQAIMTLPATPLKCAGAPLKMTFMLRDRLRQAGTLDRSTVRFQSALGNVFGVPTVNDNVLQRWNALGIETTFTQKLVALDIGARRAFFKNPEGDTTPMDYDFIHVVPPMSATAVVKQSPLAWQDGPMAAGGWLEVDPQTLQHRRFPNVFGIGDINGTPRGKTAATVKKSAPMVVQNLMDVIEGRTPTASFDGYTSCPLLIREGSAMLIEFDYQGRLVPSLPLIEPLQDSYFAWLMKVQLLKPAYVAVLKGHA